MMSFLSARSHPACVHERFPSQATVPVLTFDSAFCPRSLQLTLARFCAGKPKHDPKPAHEHKGHYGHPKHDPKPKHEHKGHYGAFNQA